MIEKTGSPNTYAMPLYGSQKSLMSRVTVSSFENPVIPAPTRKTVTQQVFGDLFTLDKKYDPKLFAQKTQEATEIFETRLQNQMSQAGIDPNEKFSYEIAPNGRPMIDGSDAVKSFFQQAFEKDPVLMQDMESVLGANGQAARDSLNAAYTSDWLSAMLSGGQDDVSSKFKPIYGELNSASNKGGFAGGHLNFAAKDYADRILNS